LAKLNRGSRPFASKPHCAIRDRFGSDTALAAHWGRCDGYFGQQTFEGLPAIWLRVSPGAGSDQRPAHSSPVARWKSS